MARQGASNNEKLKLTLLQRFRHTAEDYRQKFPEGQPGNGETMKQFATRISRYFDRWMEICKSSLRGYKSGY